MRKKPRKLALSRIKNSIYKPIKLLYPDASSFSTKSSITKKQKLEKMSQKKIKSIEKSLLLKFLNIVI